MKKLFYLLIFSLIVQSSEAQKFPTEIADTTLWQKSKSQRTAAVVLLSAGAVTTIVGLSIGTWRLFTDIIEGRKQMSGTGAMIAGVALMAGSIPFLPWQVKTGGPVYQHR